MVTSAQTQEWSGPSRRRAPRFPVQAPLDVTVLRSGVPDKVPGRALNVSERGIAAMMAGELALGEAVGIEVRLPIAGDPLQARATVKYQDKLRCGMEFVGFTAEQRVAIRDWVRETRTGTTGTERIVTSGPAPETKKIDEARKKRPKAEQKSVDGGGKKEAQEEIKSEAAKVAATAGAKRESAETNAETQTADLKTAEIKTTIIEPRKIRHLAPWATIAILIFFWTGIVLLVSWWRWNHEWHKLESGLTVERAPVEKPEAQVSAEVMEKLVVHRVEPVYPVEARAENLQGIIALDIVVGRDGSVVRMRALDGPDVLARAAMDALRWWKFEPYRVNGEPAAVETTVAVEFKR